MGMINRCRSAGLMRFGRKVNTIVVLKVTGEKQLQICKPHVSNCLSIEVVCTFIMACLPKCCCFKDRRGRPQEQVELSEVKEVEPIPGDTFSFNIHFKNKKINPWQFDALTEVLHAWFTCEILLKYYFLEHRTILVLWGSLLQYQ